MLLAARTVHAATYYVATTGLDTNAGTLARVSTRAMPLLLGFYRNVTQLLPFRNKNAWKRGYADSMCDNHFFAPPFRFKPLTAALLMLLAARTVHAATYYVATTGNDANSGASAAPWKTVAKAVNTMVAGDTTYVRGGTYNEKLILFKKSGTASAPIKLLNAPGEKPVIDFGVTPTNNVVNRFEIAAYLTNPVGWITIEGFEIRRGWDGIKFNTSANDITIRRNWIHGSKGQGILGGGINITIDRNVISQNGSSTQLDHGMYLTGSNYVITNNLVYGNATFGIQVAGYTWEGSGSYAPKKGTVPDRSYAGASNFLIANNILAYNGAAGIVIWQAEAMNNKVFNNIFYESGPLRSASGTNGVQFLNSGSGNVLNNNVFYASGAGSMTPINDCVTISGVITCYTDLRLGHYTLSNNLVNTANPGFVNAPGTIPSAPDFHLQSNSPAINRGLNLYAQGVTTDFAGAARPQTGAFEIGAYEYGGSTPPPPPAFNFSLSNGGNKTVTRGGAVTNSLTASLVSGTAQAVSLSVSGMPSGVTRSFSSTSCTPNCSSTLTLSASTAAALGTASLTVTATGGGISQTSAFTLTVNAPQTSTHSVTLSAAQAAPGGALTATVNGGSGSATQWVAVYLATAPDSAYSYKGNWKYLNGTQTAPTTAVPTPVQLTFAAPMDAGVYNLRFFANTGSGTRLALSPNLTVRSTTDLNGDGITNVTDIQVAVNQAAGGAACGSGDVNKDGACTVTDIQLVTNKALGL
jgi:hypothetical protein